VAGDIASRFVALVLIAPSPDQVCLLQNCLIRHCRTVGIRGSNSTSTRTINLRALGVTPSLMGCITDKGSAACLFFPRDGGLESHAGTPSNKPLPIHERSRLIDLFEYGLDGALQPRTRASLQTGPRLHCRRQGYLPMGKELQIVMQQVEARTTRLWYRHGYGSKS
jgi:hypothetical protein